MVQQFDPTEHGTSTTVLTRNKYDSANMEQVRQW